MPHDMFGNVAVRPSTPRSRKESVLIVSVVVHVVAIVAIGVAQLFAVGSLPAPRRPLAFQEFVPVQVADIELPPQRRNAPAARPDTTPTVSPNAAPLIAPLGITQETGLEGSRTTAASSMVIGIESGTQLGSVDGVGTAALPPPPPMPRPPVRLHSGIREPRKIVNVPPIYPPVAQAARVQGVVIIEAVIDTTGAVESARVLRSIPLLDDAALAAVRKWTYSPAMLNGMPIPVIMTVTVNFTLTP